MMRLWARARELPPAFAWIAVAGVLYEFLGTVPGWLRSGESVLVLIQVMSAKFAFTFVLVVPVVIAFLVWEKAFSKWSKKWAAWAVAVVLWVVCSVVLDIGFSSVPGMGAYYANMTMYHSESDPR